MSKENKSVPQQEKSYRDKKYDKSNMPPIYQDDYKKNSRLSYDFKSNTKEPGVHHDSAPIGGG